MDREPDVRGFVEDRIYNFLRPEVSEVVKIYRGSRPRNEDPDYFISILVENERENMPGDNHWILDVSVVLAVSIYERSSREHAAFRTELRKALMAIQDVTNVAYPDEGYWYGAYVSVVESANRAKTYGDIFRLEVRARV